MNHKSWRWKIPLEHMDQFLNRYSSVKVKEQIFFLFKVSLFVLGCFLNVDSIISLFFLILELVLAKNFSLKISVLQQFVSSAVYYLALHKLE